MKFCLGLQAASAADSYPIHSFLSWAFALSSGPSKTRVPNLSSAKWLNEQASRQCTLWELRRRTWKKRAQTAMGH